MYHLSCKPCFVDPFTQQNAVLINVSKLFFFFFFTAALKDLQEKIKHLDVLLYPFCIFTDIMPRIKRRRKIDSEH